MNNDQDWINQKNKELSFLSSLVGETFNPHEDFELFSKQKIALKNSFIKRFLPPAENSMTNMNKMHRFHIGSFEGSYLYARNGYLLENAKDNDILWGKHKLNSHTAHINLLGPCQGFFPVITKLLSNRFQSCKFIHPRDCYYETRDFFDSIDKPSHAQKTVLIIDSSSNQVPSDESIDKADAIIFDSTCINLNGDGFAIVETFLKRSIPIFIVRSHQKLDALGVEPSAFGSVVSLLPKEWSDFPRLLMRELSWTSMHAQPRDIYPWLANAEFIELTNNRNDRIRAAYKTYQEKLAKHSCQWFQHELYFKFSVPFPQEEQTKQILKFCLLNSPYVQNWASFGLDLCALVIAPDPKDSGIWRFCPGDLPLSVHSQIAESLVQFLNAKFEKSP